MRDFIVYSYVCSKKPYIGGGGGGGGGKTLRISDKFVLILHIFLNIHGKVQK